MSSTCSINNDDEEEQPNIIQHLIDTEYNHIFTNELIDSSCRILSLLKTQVSYFNDETNILPYNDISETLMKDYESSLIRLLLLSIASTKETIDKLSKHKSNLSGLFYTGSDESFNHQNLKYIKPIILYQMENPTQSTPFSPKVETAINILFNHLRNLELHAKEIYSHHFGYTHSITSSQHSIKENVISTYLYTYQDVETESITNFYKERDIFIQILDNQTSIALSNEEKLIELQDKCKEHIEHENMLNEKLNIAKSKLKAIRKSLKSENESD